MRTDIIADLRLLYLRNQKQIQTFLKSKTLIRLCDEFYIQQLSFIEMAEKRNNTESVIKKLMIKASGRIIKNQHLLKSCATYSHKTK